MTINTKTAQNVATAATNATSTTESLFQIAVRDVLSELDYLNQRDTEVLQFTVRSSNDAILFAAELPRPKTAAQGGTITKAARLALTDGGSV